jgi:hypothetical protein
MRLMRFFSWVTALLVLLAAVMLIAGIGAPALWIAVIAVCIAFVAISAKKAGNKVH